MGVYLYLRPALALAALLVLSASAPAQNPAPAEKDPTTHVTPAQSQAASSSAAQAHDAQTATAPAPDGQMKVLDSVVAIVNGDVLLESDVQQEQRLETLQLQPAADNTLARAAEHLITRTLIVQQMKEQQAVSDGIPASQLNQSVDNMRQHLPGCAPDLCATDAAWTAFLKHRDLSPEEVKDRLRQRIEIVNFLDLRFRSGVRIPRSEIRDYYEKSMLPEFQKKHQTPPPLKSLSSRIEEVLLEQQVTKQINDWEKTLRQAGTVQILVPAYGQSTNDNGEDDDPGSGQ